MPASELYEYTCFAYGSSLSNSNVYQCTSQYIKPPDVPKDRLELKELQLDRPQNHLKIG